jgi:TonB-linked SusC/RagA family outer membrane protein
MSRRRLVAVTLFAAMVGTFPTRVDGQAVRGGAIHGTVTNAADSTPVTNATVEARNSSTGQVFRATSRADGQYVLENLPVEGTYVVSARMLGYGPASRANLSVVLGQILSEDFRLVKQAALLTGVDVVAVGYGTESARNLTGAVATVTPERLEDRPITSLTRGLQGVSPNLNIVFDNGQPGSAGRYNIRGTTSINGGSPLILVDGVSSDPELLNPADIESISVLKDASSAAIYGARGAFGVILITTKKGRTAKPRTTYSANLALAEPTTMPKVVTDPYTAMSIYNTAFKAYAGVDQFSQADLDYAKQRSANPSMPAVVVQQSTAGDTYKYFSNTDWFHELYQDHHPVSQHSLTVSGAKDDLRYYLSGGLLDERGVFRYATDVYKKYNFRANLDFPVKSWLTLNNNLNYSQGDYDYPSLWGSSTDVWRYLAVTANGYLPATNPDGTWTGTGAYIGAFRDGGRGLNRNRLLQDKVSTQAAFLDGRGHISADYTFQMDGSNSRVHYEQTPFSSKPGVTSYLGIDQGVDGNAENYYHTINLFADYAQSFGSHELKGMVGFNQELRTFDSFSATANTLVGGLDALRLAVGQETNDGTASAWALRGVFYRLNYNFAGKYLLELDGRYDGTSRFPKEDRFGFFPSASAGWRVSDEPFFAPARRYITDLKLRTSYGTLGNQSVATYAYIPTMAASTASVIVNGQRPIVVGTPGLVSPQLTWEKATTFDVGTDAKFLSDRLSLVFDWYRRNTTDMLTRGRTYPATLGAAAPNENAADLSTKGWELSLDWHSGIGALLGSPVKFGLGGILSDNQSKITKFDNPTNFLGDYYVGEQLGEIWGYETEGFFTSAEDIANHANQDLVERFPQLRQVGDLKFRDLNGDGIISPGDNTLSNPGDRRIIGNKTPRYSYGITSDLAWKSFSVSAFLQGVGKMDYYPGAETSYFWSIYNRPYNTVLEHIVGNYWTPDNPNAYFPRLKGYIALVDGKDLSAPQTRYLQDASYLRLKNLTVGYDLPAKLTSRYGIDRIHVYLSGENLGLHTNLRIPVDPELLMIAHSQGDGSKYPMQRSYSFGTNFTF